MKKTLSLVLALVMILGSFSSVFAATPVSTEAEAGAFLKAAGVLVGDEKGDLNLKDNLLRQDAVILVAQLRGEIEAAQGHKGLPTYEDVKIKFYNAPLAWAQEKDLFVGHSDKVFGFGENLTAQEYSTVLLKALGYKVNGDNADVKFADALTKAKELTILENLTLTEKEEITRGEMALMTFNALGVNMKGSKETLADTLKIEMPEGPEAKELKADVKNTTNLKEVVVELSNAKLADKDKLENVNNYKIVDHEVERVEVVGNDVLVQVKGQFVEGRDYELRIRGIDTAINTTYKFVAKDSTSPKVEKVEALGEYGIKVITSEPIKVLDTDRGRSFVVDGKSIAMNVESYGRTVILTPYYNDSFSKDAKTLTVSGLEDFAGYRTAKEDFAIEVEKDEVAPKLVDLILRGNNTVEAVFDKDVYKSTVKSYYNRSSVGNISYVSGRETVYATGATKIDTNKVLYTFADELLRVRTDFTVADVANHSKLKMDTTTMGAREILDNIEPEIFKHEVIVGDGTSAVTTTSSRKAVIKLYFDKDVEGVTTNAAKTQFDVNAHFKLFGERLNASTAGTILSAEYDVVAGKTIKDVIVVKLDNLVNRLNSDEIDYILQIENFTDANSRRNNKMYRDYVEFEYDDSSSFALLNEVKVVGGNTSGETQITLKFNKSVDRLIAEDGRNYIFKETATKGGKNLDAKDLNARIITEKNGKEVTIILPKFDKDDYTSLRILDTLKDKDGNRLNKEYVYNFGLGYISNSGYTITGTAGVYNVNVDAGVRSITLATDIVGQFNVVDLGSLLTTVTIDAPNAHVVVPAGVTKVVVKNIAANSLDVESRTAATAALELVVSTPKVFNVFGDIVGMKISSTVDGANVKMGANEPAAKAATATALTKGNVVEVEVKADGSYGTKGVAAYAGAEVEAIKLNTLNTSTSGISLNVTNNKNKALVKSAAITKAQNLISSDYIVEALTENFNMTGDTIDTLKMILKITENGKAVNTYHTHEITFKVTQ